MSPIDREQLEKRLAEGNTLPPCPQVVAKVTDLCADESATARDIGRAIMADEAISTRLIKLANSSFYGLSGKVSTVTQAAIILGSNEIRSIVYALPVKDLFTKCGNEEGLDLEALWGHSVRVAALARELSYKIRYPRPEEIFVAGIIHDMGKVVLDQLLPGEYAEVLSEAEEKGLDVVAHEEEVLGTSHAEVGRRLAEVWRFPDMLADAILYHGRPAEAAEASPVAALVCAADTLERGGVYDDPSRAADLIDPALSAHVPGGEDLAEAATRAQAALSDIMQTFGFAS